MNELTDPLGRFNRAARREGWTSLMPALDELCQSSVGHRLFSCSAFRMTGPEEGVAARIYSNDPVNYPVSGLKTIVPNRWTDIVIQRRKTFVANTVEGFADVFPDHGLIASLGLGSVVNLPIVLRGEFIGTVNLLHEPGFYNSVRLRRLERLTVPALLAFSLSAEAMQ